MRVKEQLDAWGSISVEYPANVATIVARALRSWQAFCKLPIEVKLELSNSDRWRDFAYMLRNDDGPTGDSKELFHVSMRDIKAIEDRIGDLPREAIHFIDSCRDLIKAVTPLIMECAQSIEDEYGLSGFARSALANAETWTFRFLHYLDGAVLAAPHTDRGGLTLHLAENQPGGQYLNLMDEWVDWKIGNGQTIIFPGMVLQHMSECMIKALWHRVIAVEEYPLDSRYAIVAFIDVAHTHQYDQRIRTADLEPGSTYYMPMAVFEKLFIPR